MKTIIGAAFGLLFTVAPLQAQTNEKDNGQPNNKEVQTQTVTNVAGDRIVTQPAKMENGNGAIPKEEGTDAVANSTSSSNKPKPNTQQASGTTVKDTTGKNASAKATLPAGRNGKGSTVNSGKTNNGNARLERTSRGSTPTGNKPNKNAKKGRNAANTPVDKPKVHAPKPKKDVY
jgi:hypothetical protein